MASGPQIRFARPQIYADLPAAQSPLRETLRGEILQATQARSTGFSQMAFGPQIRFARPQICADLPAAQSPLHETLRTLRGETLQRPRTRSTGFSQMASGPQMRCAQVRIYTDFLRTGPDYPFCANLCLQSVRICGKRNKAAGPPAAALIAHTWPSAAQMCFARPRIHTDFAAVQPALRS